MNLVSGLVFGLAFFASTAFAQNAKPTPVNVHNFVRAETDLLFRQDRDQGRRLRQAQASA